MPFSIAIVDKESKKPLAGTVKIISSAGQVLIETSVPANGLILNDYLRQGDNHIYINSVGYSEYGAPTQNLYDDTEFRLEKKVNKFGLVLMGVALGIGMPVVLSLFNTKRK